MTGTREAVDRYCANFEALRRQVSVKEPRWLQKRREDALVSFTQEGFPTTAREEWKSTSVEPLTKISFQSTGPPRAVSAENLPELLAGETARHRLVFLNGVYAPRLSSVDALPTGVVLGGLSDAWLTDVPILERHLARHARYQHHAFVALNTAFMPDGALVYIPANTVVERPIELLFLAQSQEAPSISHPRMLLIAGPGSRATIVESYTGLGERVYFTNAVAELVLDEGAVIDHYRVEHEQAAAFHVASRTVRQDRDSQFTCLSLTLGGALVRTEMDVMLRAEGAECELTGLYGGAGLQHVDIQTRLAHEKPHCTSRQLFKGVLDEQARGIFTGRIRVQPHAQQTDASLTNKNLLLSDKASVETRPQLQILADDVTCTHGATVGQLDDDAMFYLRSRGISAGAARALMVSAFAREIIKRIKLDPLRESLSGVFLRWTARLSDEARK